MSDATTTVFEHHLSEALLQLRPNEPVSAALRDRVRTIPNADPAPSIIGRLRRPAFVVGLVATSAILLAVVRLSSVVRPVGVGTTQGALGVDPMVEGPGIVTSIAPSLPVVGWGVVVAMVLAAARLAMQRPRSGRRLAVAAVCLAVAAGALGLTIHPGPGDAGWNGFGPVLGFRQVDSPGVIDEAGNHLETLFEAAGPGEPFAVVFVVGNQGTLPVRLEGVREDPNAASRIAPRWTALGIGTDPQAVGQPLDAVAPFVPTDIQPGGYVLLYLIGKASACAIGAAPYASDQAFAIRGPDIELVYSLFGLTNTTTYHMPLVIEEPIRNGCTG